MTLDYKTNTIINTARTTGFWYLLLTISGIVGFLVFHSKVFVADDPQKTLKNLLEKESLARTRLLLEFVILPMEKREIREDISELSKGRYGSLSIVGGVL